MVDVGDDAPDFTAPLANGDVETVTLSESLDDGPVVLAFFPAAFTGVCTTEMCTFRDEMADFEDVDATVLGVSVDLPFTHNEFRRQNDLNFGLVSDHDRSIVEEYGVSMSFTGHDIEVAKRSVFVVDGDGTVTYRWVSDDPGVEPDYEAVDEAVRETATA
ncbi:MAG: redoxin domain-containing protein [Haloplanus sp.]